MCDRRWASSRYRIESICLTSNALRRGGLKQIYDHAAVKLLPLIGRKKEELIFLDRPSECATVNDTLLKGLGGWPRAKTVEKVRRVRMLIVEINKGASMIFVRAIFGDNIDRRSHRKSKLRREGIAVHLEFLHRVQRYVDHALSPRAKVILTAINCEQIGAPVAAADRKP